MIKNILITNVSQTGATISGKAPYTIIPKNEDYRVYSLTFDQTTLKVYVNGELIGTAANSGNMKFLNDIYIGADFDDTEHFYGSIPVISFYDKAVPDTQRVLMEDWLADRWLTNGTVMASGHTVTTAGTKPTWSTTLGKAFLDFDAEGLATTGASRVVSWTDSTSVGTNRVASPKTGTTCGITIVKGLSALTFDTKTYLKIPALDNTANSPNPVTIFFVAKWYSYDISFYSGDNAQTLLGAASNAAFRFKKFDTDTYFGMRFSTNASGNSTINVPKNKIIIPAQAVGSNSVKLQLSTDNAFSSYTESSPQTANGTTNYGVTQHTFNSLAPSTKYYGRFIVDGTPETGNVLSFSTFKNSNSFKIIAGSCNQTASNHTIWNQMLTENADMFIHTGDLHYENILSTDPQDYAYAQDLAFSGSNMANFFKNQAMTYIYDNHDSLGANPNNTFDWTTFLPFFTTAYPTYPTGSATPNTDGHYWSFVIGRTKCIVNGMRVKRDPITDTDTSGKTTMGTVQKTWFKNELLAAKNAGQSVLWFGGICYISDFDNPLSLSYLKEHGGMSWANYTYERRELANYIFDNNIPNVTYVHGDSHMIAIDNGINSIYATTTTSGTTRRAYGSFDDRYLIRNLSTSPFDKDQDVEGGPFQLNSVEDSGGPVTMPIDIYGYSQAYGIIEVTDIGENWQQVKLTNMMYNGSTFVEAQSYTFNSPMSGTSGTPPPIIIEGEVNQNGYIGKDGEYEPIKKRYIGSGNTWLPEQFKFVGDNGFWKLTYTGDEIKKLGTFIVTSLEGYDLERENSVTMYGENLLDYSIVSPKAGAYYELSRNMADLFDNFSSGTLIGSPIFTTVGGKQALKMTGTTQGFQLPITGGGLLDATGIFGTDGLKSYTLALNVYVPSLPTGTNVIPLYGYGVVGNGVEAYITSGGSITLENHTSIGVSNTLSTGNGKITTGWNNLLIERIATGTSIYTKSSGTTPLVTGQMTYHTNSGIIPFKVGVNFSSISVDFSYSGSAYRNFYYKNAIMSPANKVKLLDRANPEVVLLSGSTQIVINEAWINSTTNDYIKFTIPTGTTFGNYGCYLRYVNSLYTGDTTWSYAANESFKFPIRVRNTNLQTTLFVDDFSDPNTLSNNYYILNKAWGGANGGVVTENVNIRNGELIFTANGDRYTGSVQGVDRDGNPKLHTDVGDPKLGQPWTNRVGGCIVFNKKTGFGSYEIEAMIPNNLGTAYAMWTFHYNEIYPTDPRYQSFLDEGLHEQGNATDGFYITRNHEIDIELPSHFTGGVYNNPTFYNMKNNTWRGELYNESTVNLSNIGFYIADGNYHKLRFDWYPSGVTFYIDGVLKQTNTTYVPDIPGFFTFGTWFPSAKKAGSPWLVEPANAWAGGVIDPDGGMKANFDSIEMKVRKFTFNPFSAYTGSLRLKGETYAFGGYSKKN